MSHIVLRCKILKRKLPLPLHAVITSFTTVREIITKMDSTGLAEVILFEEKIQLRRDRAVLRYSVRLDAWQASQATRRFAHAPSTCPTVAILVVIALLWRKKLHDIRRRNFAQARLPEKIAFYRYVARCRAHRVVMFFRRRIAALSPQSREFDALFCNDCLAILRSWLHVGE